MKKPAQSPISHSPAPTVAIVADWISGLSGAERVLLELHKAFPDAPIYTSTYEPGAIAACSGVDIRTSWMQKLPTFLRKHQLLTIPRQWYFGRLKLRGYDIVISAGSNEAKAVRAPDGKHIHMCYTPTLFYWVKPQEYLDGGSGGLNPIWRLGLKILLPYAKRWDLKASKRPDAIYAISTAVQDRIKEYYGRSSKILYPPTDTERFANDGTQNKQGFVFFGRQVQHKKADLAIAACNEIGAKLVVVGDGPEHKRLVDMAGPTITFKTNVSDKDIVKYVASAEAFIFPNEEDFGIVALEAQAAGTPVIAYRRGGSLDTVVEGVTGEQTIESLSKALMDFNYKLYNRQAIVDQAERFSAANFHKNLKKIVRDVTENQSKS